jgi:hypothetical protein
MKHPQTLPSPLKIAAEVDAALAAAGLAGPQVEREAIPLYRSYIQELIDVDGKKGIDFQHMSPREIAQVLTCWGREQGVDEKEILRMLTEQLDEVLLLSAAHGTLSDMKRRKMLNFHQQIVDFIPTFFSQTQIIVNKGL